MTSENDLGNPKTEQQRRISVQAQYIKDLSFENPNAPTSLLSMKSAPSIEINVDINATALQDDLYEVALVATAKAVHEEKIVFVIDLTYAGLFTIQGIEGQEREITLMVYCPSILFPFVRRVFSDVSRDGGFPPLMLEPIDFASLYQSRKHEVQKMSEPDAPKNTDDANVSDSPKESNSDLKEEKKIKNKKSSSDDDSHF